MKKTLHIIGLVFLSIGLQAQFWSTQFTGFPDQPSFINQISIADSNTVWLNAWYGSSNLKLKTYSRTQNGGTTWTSGSYTGMTGSVYPSVLAAVNYSSAFCIAYDTLNLVSTFWKTVDGINWSKVNGVMNNGPITFGNGVMFWDQTKGFCYGDPVNNKFDIYNTTDGGITWNSIAAGNITAPLAGETGYNNDYCECKVNGGIAMFITNKGRVYKTTDYGATWATTPTAPFSSSGGGKIYASSANYIIAGWMFTDSTTYTWKYTNNGGVTWQLLAPTGNFYEDYICYVHGSQNMFVSSALNTSLSTLGVSYSNDGGLNWTNYTDPLLQTSSNNIAFMAIGFYSPNIGWVANLKTGPTTILKYYNPNSSIGINTYNINLNDISIYPNPAKDKINFEMGMYNGFKLSIFNSIGQQVIKQNVNSGNNTINIQSLTKGIYFYKLINNKSKVISGKFIID